MISCNNKIQVVCKPKISIADEYYIYHVTIGKITNKNGSDVSRADKDGYRVYNDCNSKKFKRVHRVIYEKATGVKIPDKMKVCHRNGDKSDNRFSNLHLGKIHKSARKIRTILAGKKCISASQKLASPNPNKWNR
jgi:hypothetical protein